MQARSVRTLLTAHRRPFWVCGNTRTDREVGMACLWLLLYHNLPPNGFGDEITETEFGGTTTCHRSNTHPVAHPPPSQEKTTTTLTAANVKPRQNKRRFFCLVQRAAATAPKRRRKAFTFLQGPSVSKPLSICNASEWLQISQIKILRGGCNYLFFF